MELKILYFSFSEMSDFLVFAQHGDIRAVSLNVEYYADVVLYSDKLANAVAVHVDTQEGITF